MRGRSAQVELSRVQYEKKKCGKLERENGKKWEFGNVCWIWRIKLRCATLQALHFAVLRHAGVPGAMRLSLFGSGVRAVLLLLPAALTLCLTFYVWTSRKRPDLSEGASRSSGGSNSACIAMALCLVASIDQLKTRRAGRLLVGAKSVRRVVRDFGFRRSPGRKRLD